ncbi:MAG: hypothetical protein JO269_07900 [Burkholderiaceae bacterium]|nr:hypothetical protein [Burkholderiaceae bacterium]
MHKLSEFRFDLRRRNRKHIIWGVLLIGLGSLFLLYQLDILDVVDFWQFWPAFIVLAGVVNVLSATRFRHVTRGLFEIVVGAWLYVSIENLWGLHFGNSWPILLIAYGIVIAAEGVADHLHKEENPQ